MSELTEMKDEEERREMRDGNSEKGEDEDEEYKPFETSTSFVWDTLLTTAIENSRNKSTEYDSANDKVGIIENVITEIENILELFHVLIQECLIKGNRSDVERNDDVLYFPKRIRTAMKLPSGPWKSVKPLPAKFASHFGEKVLISRKSVIKRCKGRDVVDDGDDDLDDEEEEEDGEEEEDEEEGEEEEEEIDGGGVGGGGGEKDVANGNDTDTRKSDVSNDYCFEPVSTYDPHFSKMLKQANDVTIEESVQRRLTPAQKKVKYDCPKCGKTFIKKSYAAHHTEKCTGLASDEVIYPKHYCFFCGKDFSTFACYQVHINNCTKRTASDKGFVCIKCKNYIVLNEESREDRAHVCEPFYRCGRCEFMSFERQPYREHYLKEHLGIMPKVYCCETCGKTMNHKGDLVKHKRTHTKERPFTCTFCWKSFSRRSILNIHITTHKSEAIPCDVCGKIFGNKKKVIEHTRSQHPKDGIQVRHPCSFCCASFRSKSYLSRHQQSKHYNELHNSRLIHVNNSKQ